MVTELTKENFEDAVSKSDFIVIDFWAPWCGPCRSFAPIFEKASEENLDIDFVKINTQDEQELAGTFNIRSIPTLMIIRDHIIVYAQPGALMGNQFNELIKQVRELDMDKVKQEIKEEESTENKN